MNGMTQEPTHSREDRPEALLPELADVEEVIRRLLAPGEPCLEPAAAHALRSAGKRLRPVVFLLLAKALGQRPGVAHIVVAAVLELCHTASLFHDDVLDRARVRRGRETLHTLRGNREAVLYGDHVLAGAFQLLADLSRPDLVALMAALVRRVCAGEIKQWSRRGRLLPRQEYLAIIAAKTASFFHTAGILAGRLAGLDAAHAARLGCFGENFGMAYQIGDDLYDIVAPPRADKSTGRDSKAGILTLPWICLRDAHGSQALRDLYFKIDGKDRARVLEDARMRAALRESAEIAAGLLREGAAFFEELPQSPARDALAALAEDLRAKIMRFTTGKGPGFP